MNYDQMTVREANPLPALSVRLRVPHGGSAELARHVQRIDEVARRQGAGGGRVFLRHLGEDLVTFHLEVGVVHEVALAGEGDIQPVSLPGGHVATLLLARPAEDIPEAVRALEAWARHLGHDPAGPPYQVLGPRSHATGHPETLLLLPLGVPLD